MFRTFGITVSALILAAQLGSPLSAAEPSLDELSTIAGFLSNNNVRGLRAYLTQHPDLLQEDTTLAALLRDFMKQSENMNTFLGFQPGLRGAFSNLGGGASDNDGSGGGSSTPASPY